MQCKLCQEPATGACRKCGGFYCGSHGGKSPGGPLCASCYDGTRPLMVVGALVAAGFGVFAVFLTNSPRVGETWWVPALIALGAFGMALHFLWSAFRSFPGAE